MEQRTFIVDENGEDLRIDKYLALLMEDCSRSYIQKIIGDQSVTVNGKSVKANYKVGIGDAVEIQIPDPVILDIQPENITLDILYEDDDILIINKPKDMVVHPAPGHYTGTLVNAVMYHCGDQLSTINGVLRPGIVHRIDKDTTGYLSSARMTRPIGQWQSSLLCTALQEPITLLSTTISKRTRERWMRLSDAWMRTERKWASTAKRPSCSHTL